MLSARDYIERADASKAGQITGGSYALMILIVLAFMTWSDLLPITTWQTMWLAAAIVVTMRVGFEEWMGSRWDHFEHVRHHLMQTQGLDTHTAFERVRRMKY